MVLETKNGYNNNINKTNNINSYYYTGTVVQYQIHRFLLYPGMVVMSGPCPRFTRCRPPVLCSCFGSRLCPCPPVLLTTPLHRTLVLSTVDFYSLPPATAAYSWCTSSCSRRIAEAGAGGRTERAVSRQTQRRRKDMCPAAGQGGIQQQEMELEVNKAAPPAFLPSTPVASSLA